MLTQLFVGLRLLCAAGVATTIESAVVVVDATAPLTSTIAVKHAASSLGTSKEFFASVRDIVIVWRAFAEDTAMELYEVCVGTAQDAGDIVNCTIVHPQPTMEFAIAEHLKGSADQDVAKLQTAIVSGTCVCAFYRWALVWRAHHLAPFTDLP